MKVYKNKIKIPEKNILEDMHREKKLSAKKIGEFFGVSDSLVRNWFKHRDIKAVNHCYIGIPSKEDVWAVYEEEGGSQERAGKRFGVSQMRYGKWMKKHGLFSLKKKCERVPKYEESYKSYIIDKMSTVEFGKKYNMSSTHAGRLLRKYGIPLRSVGRNSERIYSDMQNVDLCKNKNLSYILGLVCGDMCIDRRKYYRLSLTSGDMNWIRKVEGVFLDVNLKCHINEIKTIGKKKLFRLSVCCKNLVEFVQKALPYGVLNFIGDDSDMIRAFVCSFYESEGCLSSDGRLIISTTYKWKVDIFVEFLRRLGYVRFSIREEIRDVKNIFRMSVFASEAEKFLEEMKPCIKCHGYYKDGR